MVKEKVVLGFDNYAISEEGNLYNHNYFFDIVCEYYKVSREDLESKCRKPHCVIPRHILQYLMRTELNMNYADIGKLFNRRFNTVMYAENCINNQLNNRFDKTIKNDIAKLKDKLK